MSHPHPVTTSKSKRGFGGPQTTNELHVARIDCLRLLCVEYAQYDAGFNSFMHTLFARHDKALNGQLDKKMLQGLVAEAAPRAHGNEIVEVVDYVWSHSAKQGPNNTSYVDFGGLSAIASQVDVHPFFWDNFKHDFIPDTTSFDSGGFDGDEGTDEDALIAAVANHWVEFRSAVTTFLASMAKDPKYRQTLTLMTEVRDRLNRSVTTHVDGSRAIMLYRKILALMGNTLFDAFRHTQVSDTTLLKHQLRFLEASVSNLALEYDRSTQA
eukprot:TRINITY_DN25693_c0_g1_i1.p1 TRINITY_DN25693_c0_g1~~TRINITY_DN25693_c0_g1_i1.p1  ORF type:complete len:294 (+),score=38.44 TRINITY_DN25693_c0_g1_i1:79-882(+)